MCGIDEPGSYPPVVVPSPRTLVYHIPSSETRPLPVLCTTIDADIGNISVFHLVRELAQYDDGFLLIAESGIETETVFESAAPRAVEACSKITDRWLIASGGGVDTDGRRHVSQYRPIDHKSPIRYLPRIALELFQSPILVNVAEARAINYDKNKKLSVDATIALGYAHGIVSLISPQLSTANIDKLIAEPISEGDLERNWRKARKIANDSLGDRRSIAQSYREAVRNLEDEHTANFCLSIITRTQFSRPGLLRRLGSSICAEAARSAVPIEWVVSFDSGIDGREQFEISDFESELVSPKLVPVDHTPGLASRYTNLVYGVEAATRGVTLVVDDDDYLAGNALVHLRRKFLGSALRPLVFHDSVVMDEVWHMRSNGRLTLATSKYKKTWTADGWRHAFRGTNHTPVCGFTAPTELLARSLRSVRGDLERSEDYALLLAMLLDPELPEILELFEPVVAISHRRAGLHPDNIALESDRSVWLAETHAQIRSLVDQRQEAVGGLQVAAVAAEYASTARLQPPVMAAISTGRTLAQSEAEVTELRLRLAKIAEESSKKRKGAVKDGSDDGHKPDVVVKPKGESE